MPKWFSREWETEELTQIDFGHYDDESNTTLNGRRGRKRDVIAYWAKHDFRLTIFNVLRNHIAELDVQTPIVDLREDQDPGNFLA